jgi:hypothetical protein
MTDIEAVPGPLSLSFGQSSLVKMEERKRPVPYDQNESAPPLKRQATASNGANKPHVDADMPWKDDLEVSHLPYDSSMPLLTSSVFSVFKKKPFTVR